MPFHILHHADLRFRGIPGCSGPVSDVSAGFRPDSLLFLVHIAVDVLVLPRLAREQINDDHRVLREELSSQERGW